MTLDPKKIAGWKALAEAAPPELFEDDEDSDGLWRYSPNGGAEKFYGAAREAVPALLAEREEMLALLREIEWEGGATSDDSRCMFCQGHRERETIWREADPDRPGETRTRVQPSGHAPDCRLASFLR